MSHQESRSVGTHPSRRAQISCPGRVQRALARAERDPGPSARIAKRVIHSCRPGSRVSLRSPGTREWRRVRNRGSRMSRWPWPHSRCQTAQFLRSRGALLRPGLSFIHSHPTPMEGWAERRQAHYFICRVCETRRVRTQRGAARPMTRDARLSALHRGDFRPGAALPSPALPPDPCSDAPRSQVVVPGGRCPGQPAHRSETSGDGR